MDINPAQLYFIPYKYAGKSINMMYYDRERKVVEFEHTSRTANMQKVLPIMLCDYGKKSGALLMRLSDYLICNCYAEYPNKMLSLSLPMFDDQEEHIQDKAENFRRVLALPHQFGWKSVTGEYRLKLIPSDIDQIIANNFECFVEFDEEKPRLVDDKIIIHLKQQK